MKQRFLVAVAALALAACSGEPEAPRPNVVLISIDTLRPDFMGIYGHDRPTSPSLDRFASQGTVFTDVTSASPWTLPSHASMLTGLYPSSHGVKNHDRQLTKDTLATRFKRVGYETLAVVNSHNIGDKRFGLLRGFEKSHYESEMTVGADQALLVNQGTRIVQQARKYLEERDPERPFFLFLHFYDVHTDFTPDAKWKLEFVEPYNGELNGNTQQLVKYRSLENELSPEDVVWLEQMYEAEIRTFDEVLKRLLDFVDASGLGKDTIVAITSDHGEEYWEHHGTLHGRTYYQEVIRVPILMRGPGIPAGKRVDTPVHLVDLPTTLFELARVPAPDGLDGIDLSQAWSSDAGLPAQRYLFAEADHNNVWEGQDVSDVRRMIRIGDEKLCYDTLSGVKELYDLAADPLEQNDLAAARPERVDELFAELERFMQRPVESGARVLDGVDEELQADLQRLGY